MLAPLEGRSILNSGGSEVDVRRCESGLLSDPLEAGGERIAALAGELDCLRSRCAMQERRIAAYASGEAVVALGRRLMELSAANDGLRETAARAVALQSLLAATRDEVLRIAAERDALIEVLDRARKTNFVAEPSS